MSEIIENPEIVKIEGMKLSDTALRTNISSMLENLKDGEGIKLPIKKRSGLYKFTKEGYTIKYTEDKKYLVIFKTPNAKKK